MLSANQEDLAGEKDEEDKEGWDPQRTRWSGGSRKQSSRQDDGFEREGGGVPSGCICDPSEDG